jgi:hypothetical protein
MAEKGRTKGHTPKTHRGQYREVAVGTGESEAASRAGNGTSNCRPAHFHKGGYQLFQFRCNGHHLRSEPPKHKAQESKGGDWQREARASWPQG